MANDGATAAYLKHRRAGDAATAALKCQKIRGRYIDTGRRVCEGHPRIYKDVLYSLCGSCACTKNKGHRSDCVNCQSGPPKSVCDAQALAQQRAAKAGQLFGQAPYVPKALAAPALVGGSRGSVGGVSGGGRDNSGRRDNRWGRRGGGGGGGAAATGGADTTILDITAKPRADGMGWDLVGKGKAASQVARAENKRRDDERKAAAAANPANSLANGGGGSPGSSATAPSADPAPTHTAAELQSIITLLQKGGDETTAAVYQEKLKALRAPGIAPKTLTYANAKRLAEEASKRLDKASAKVHSAELQLQAAKEDVAVAALALREAKATQTKLFESEKAANANTDTRSTKICVDKIILG